MEITAQMVKELRESTGAGMMDCKKALAESGGDLTAAVDVLRTKGLADLAKKAGRATNEGLVAAYVEPSGKIAALVEVNCETDFVARNDQFATFVNALAEQVAVDDPDGISQGAAPLMVQQFKRNPALTVEASLGEMVTKLGENMGVTRFQRYELIGPAVIGSYIHGVGRIGVLVEVVGADETAPGVAQLARDIAMHVAAAAPGWVTREDVPADVVEHEKSIYMAQAAESGKPEAIQAKIAEGRVDKFFKEVTLLEQPFVKDPDTTVGALVAKVSKQAGAELAVARFTRWVLGETSDAPAEDCGC
jgi:elongation factor Ts